jgi:hypothetical protein
MSNIPSDNRRNRGGAASDRLVPKAIVIERSLLGCLLRWQAQFEEKG